MAALLPLGNGLDAVIVSTAQPTAEERIERYRAALARRPDRFHGLRVQFGEMQQRAMKNGVIVRYSDMQRRWPALWLSRLS